jgi:ribosomal protein L40E
MISFFSSFGTFEPPRYFWAAFLGLPLLVIGLGLTRFGYLGAILRYFSGEVAPVAKDTFNHMAHGTAEGVETLAQALSRGLAGGGRAASHPDEASISCGQCTTLNPASAQFCSRCGAALVSKACPDCGASLAPDARFCGQCGKAVVGGPG